MRLILACLTACAMLCGCAPTVFVLHSPLQPAATQPVTYTATAERGSGVAAIDIWEMRSAPLDCIIVANPNAVARVHCVPPTPTRIVGSCNFSPPVTPATCTVASGPFQNGTLVTYRAVARDSAGNAGEDGWITYMAGTPLAPNDPIPVYVRGPPHQSIDLVFIPDPDYNNSDANFIADVETLVTNSYLGPSTHAALVRGRRTLWNLYVTYQEGDAQGYGSGCNVVPPNWTALNAVVDAGAIVHSADLRDCGGRPPNGLFSVRGGVGADYVTMVHETGHTVFDLADEYCCDGGYWFTSPEPNVFDTLADCSAATDNCAKLEYVDSCHGDASVTTAPDIYRSQDANDLMMCGDSWNHSPDRDRFDFVYQVPPQ